MESPFKDIMAEPVRSVETNRLGDEDPWNWTVDQVVKAVCHHDSPLLKDMNDSELILSNPKAFEQTLRENGVRGLTFLKEVDHASLRDDLCMKNLGDRSSVLHLIQDLRRKSPKYIAHLHAEAAMRPVSGYERFSSVCYENALGSPFPGSPNKPVSAIRPHNSIYHYPPTAPSSRVVSWVHNQNPACQGPDFSHSPATEKPRNELVEAPSLPRPVPLSPSSSFGRGIEDGSNIQQTKDGYEREDTGHEGRDSTPLVPVQDLTKPTAGELGFEPCERPGETVVVDEMGRKRRRLILGTPEPLSTSTSSHEIENEVPSDEESSKSDAELTVNGLIEETASADAHVENTTHDVSVLDNNPEPGVVAIDDRGRKRLKPLLVSPLKVGDSEMHSKPSEGVIQTIDASLPYSTSAVGTTDSAPSKIGRNTFPRRADQIYMGTNALHIDQVIYGRAQLGQEIKNAGEHENASTGTSVVGESDEFMFDSQGDNGTGQRIYVNKQIQRLLRSTEPQVFQYRDRKVAGIIPYPDGLGRKQQPLSMTVFRKTSDGYIATRENRAIWKIDDQQPLIDAEANSSTINVPEVLFGEQFLDALDPDNLEKWKYLDGNDEVLPAFGDSGSEGEYDLDTWREMEDEQGKLKRPPAMPASRKTLDHAQVNAIVDRAIDTFADDWRLKNPAKLQRRTWRLWQTMKRFGDQEIRIGEINTKVHHLNARLHNLRKEILREVWSSEQQVMKQTKSMQETVFAQEDAKWQLETVNLKSAPEKPAPLPKKTRLKTLKPTAQPLKEGEEDLQSEVSQSETSDEGMSDFIVEDEDNANPVINEEPIMADIEDEGNPDLFLPTTTELISKRETPNKPMQHAPPESDIRLPPVKEERKPANQPDSNHSSKSETNFIDLTQLSDPVEPFIPAEATRADTSATICTPPLDAVDDTDASFRRYRRKPVEFKQPSANREIIDIGSDSDIPTEILEPRASQTTLPDYHEVGKICQLEVEYLEERQDRKRLLVWVIARSPSKLRQSAIKLFDTWHRKVMRKYVWKGLSALDSHSLKIRSLESSESTACMLIASWFICWTIPVRMHQAGGIDKAHLSSASDDIAGFPSFYSFLGECLAHYKEVKPEPRDRSATKGTPVKKRLLHNGYGGTPHGKSSKRKYVVEESQAAQDLQYKAQMRVQERERRVNQLQMRLEAMGVNDEDPAKVIINISKEDDQDFIYINRKIGHRIQPHQKEGVQFMWREITSEHEELQGCLLAHTMGLGKTMQVITVLVTIAEAAKSSNGKVSGQIPPALRRSQTLVLCPPALLENWYEEFLMWAPDPWTENVGEIRKISSALNLSERIEEIEDWRDCGGVLLVAYTNFREFIQNPKRKNGPLMDEETHKRMIEALLKKPNMIVADEAHTFKNMDSGIWKAMKSFKSTSRIALTGSPLSNNLEEYYTLVEWIAPNYLGERVHFRAHYLEPIEQGLYIESTEAEYLESRKRLKALQQNLEPKMQRADISVLEKRLKGKTEFLITLPLTPLQDKVYRDYVEYMMSAVKSEGENSSILWVWLGELRLLCNHPSCFEAKLRSRAAEAQRAMKGVKDGSPEANKNKKKKKQKLPLDVGASGMDEEAMGEDGDCVVDPGLPTPMLERLLTNFKDLDVAMDSVYLSYKMVVLMQILDFAEEVGDKTLVFTHSLPTLDYVTAALDESSKKYLRIDGSTKPTARQQITRDFNQNDNDVKICLISTRAGGLGLNMFGANRVVILDTNFNPMHEEQAIGRAYRIGQQKFVYVYRLMIGGTFEEGLLNQALFKQQLATRVVDKRNPKRHAPKGAKQYLFHPKALRQDPLDSFIVKDPQVLGRILSVAER